MDKSFKVIEHYFNEEIEVYPIGDVHLGSIAHNSNEWIKFWQMIQNKPNAYIMLVGDMMNNNTRSSVGDIFKDDILTPSEQRKLLANYLEPIKDRILCIVSGNHEARKDNRDSDTNPMELVAERLNLDHLYRDNMAIVKLGIGEARSSREKAQCNYYIAIAHGSAGGAMTGASVNKNERFSYFIEGIDCLITGHTHKGVISRPARMVINRNTSTVQMKSCLVLTCCSWLDYGGYALRKQLQPAETSRPQTIFVRKSKEPRLEVLW